MHASRIQDASFRIGRLHGNNVRTVGEALQDFEERSARARAIIPIVRATTQPQPSADLSAFRGHLAPAPSGHQQSSLSHKKNQVAERSLAAPGRAIANKPVVDTRADQQLSDALLAVRRNLAPTPDGYRRSRTIAQEDRPGGTWPAPPSNASVELSATSIQSRPSPDFSSVHELINDPHARFCRDPTCPVFSLDAETATLAWVKGVRQPLGEYPRAQAACKDYLDKWICEAEQGWMRRRKRIRS